MTPKQPPVLAYVTVTYSPGETLATFVESTETASTLPSVVVVSDNGSTDGAPEAAAKRWPELHLVANDANLGYGTAVNRGAAALPDSVRYIAVCNPDTRLGPGSMDILVAAIDADPTIGAVGPRIHDDEGQVYPSARRLPSIRNGTGHALFTLPWPENPWSRSYHSPGTPRPDGTFSSGWLSGSCVVVRRDVFEKIGGFDEEFFMYFEDVDLGRRIGDAGYLNVYVPTADVSHTGGVSTRKHAAKMIEAHHRSAYLYLAKTHPGPLLGWLRSGLRIGLRARSRWLRRAR